LLDDISYPVFAAAMDRKFRLFELFEQLEGQEKIRNKRRKPAVKRPYLEIKKSMGTVVEIGAETIHWRRRDGSTFKVRMTTEICSLLRINDKLLMSVGQRANDWRVLFVGAIVNDAGETHSVPFDQ
jgi:hypothetical protein